MVLQNDDRKYLKKINKSDNSVEDKQKTLGYLNPSLGAFQ